MTELAVHLDRYLAARRAMGYRLVEHGRVLAMFVAHLDSRDEATVTIDAALSWASPPETTADQAARRLSMIRGFARYLQAFEPGTEVPPVNLIAGAQQRKTPYLYSCGEVDALMRAARGLRPVLWAASLETLIGLTAATGMRPGEARGLDRGDVDLDAGELTVRTAKLNKTRLLPLHPTVTVALSGYAAQRDTLCSQPTTEAFFVTAAGARLGRHQLSAVFVALRHQAGITAGPGRRPPRLYDLRHSFAVNTVLDWHADDVDVQARLPVLSTYMGHIRPSATYWYLQAAPELMAVVAARVERASRLRP